MHGFAAAVAGRMPAAGWPARLGAGGMMSNGSRGRSTSERRARARPGAFGQALRRRGARPRRLAAGLAAAALASTALAACGTSSAGTGPVTLTYYLYPDSSGATQQAISNCDKQSGGKYTISYQQLPTGSDGQRQQLVQPPAAHDSTIDIMGLDVTWEAELAEAGLVLPGTRAGKAPAEKGTVAPAPQTPLCASQLYS